MASYERYMDKDGKNKWRCHYRKPNGKGTTKEPFRTKGDAQKWYATIEVSKMRGEYVSPAGSRMTVGAVVRKWQDGRSEDLAPSTYERYVGIIRTHIIPKWGPIPLGGLFHSDIQGWVAELSRDGLAPASIRKTVRPLRLALQMAVKDKLISTNPADDLIIAVPKIAPRRYLDHAQVRSLVNACGDRGAVVLVLAYCGLRWGEMAALHVRNVNLMTKRINVEESVTEVNGKLTWGDPKGKQRRWVPIPSFIVDDLMVALAGKGPDDLAFTGQRRGGVLRSRVARRSWFDKAVMESGSPEGFHPHELRHTAASLSIKAVPNVKVVQRMLGHESAAMTLDTYADLFPDDLDELAEKLDAEGRAALAALDAAGRAALS